MGRNSKNSKNQNDKNNNTNNNMNQIFYDEFDTTKVKILLCLDDQMLLKYSNNSVYQEEENKKNIREIKKEIRKKSNDT